jgi:hypothetical protein
MILFDQSATASTNPQGLIQMAWRQYKGNVNWPNPGDPKYLGALMIANHILVYEYALDEKIHWDSLFDGTRTYGPIQAGVQDYDLDNDVFALSDYIYVNRTDGNTDRFQVVHPESRNRSFNAIGTIASDDGDPVCYLTGSAAGGGSNLTINFEDKFVAGGNMGGDIGGTISCGVYAMPTQLQNPSDVVPVNNPGWLALRLATELARNDPAKQDQVPDLQAQATALYNKMVIGNQTNSFQQPNGPAYMKRNPGVTWQTF